MYITYVYYCLQIVSRFDKSAGIVAHIIMIFVSFLFLISLFLKVPCIILSFIHKHIKVSVWRDTDSCHPALNIGSITKRTPVNFGHGVWLWFCNFPEVRKPAINPTFWQLFMSVFTFAVRDGIEYFGDLAWVVDPGRHGVGRLEAVQSQGRLLLVH